MTAGTRLARDNGTTGRDPQSRVPVRTIAATIAMVLLTAAVLLLGWEVRRVLTWIVVAALLAIILGPLVDITQRRLHLHRALATLLVFLVTLIALAGILTMFIRPLANEGPQFIDRVPSYVEQARTGRGPVGRLVQRYNLDEYLQRNQARLRESANRLTTPALGVLRSIFSTVVALVTIFVLTFLMVLQGPALLAGMVAALPERRQERVRRVAADCAKAVTGYMTGNLLISIIAGTVTYVVLWIMGVPYRGVVALFVGFADLIPLVGAHPGRRRGHRRGRPALATRRDRGPGRLRGLPAAGEPRPAAGHHVAHRSAVRTDRAGQHPHRGRVVRIPRGVARHPGGRSPPCHRPRPLRQLPRPPQARPNHRDRPDPAIAASTTRTRRAAIPRRHRHRPPLTRSAQPRASRNCLT
jgi:predicted PurR-regulated permease PerM